MRNWVYWKFAYHTRISQQMKRAKFVNQIKYEGNCNGEKPFKQSLQLRVIGINHRIKLIQLIKKDIKLQIWKCLILKVCKKKRASISLIYRKIEIFQEVHAIVKMALDPYFMTWIHYLHIDQNLNIFCLARTGCETDIQQV